MKCKSKRSPNVTCSYCGKRFYRKPSSLKKSKTGLYFCSREHKDLAQRINSGSQFSEMRPDHYHNGNSTYAERAMEVYGASCVDCGLSIRPLLEVHHIDGNRENGDISNLEVVCFTHHAIRHMKFVDGEWKFSGHYLTPREMLDELRSMTSAHKFGSLVHDIITTNMKQ